VDPVISQIPNNQRKDKKKLKTRVKLSCSMAMIPPVMVATTTVTATPVSVNTKAEDADGALVEPSATEVLERLHSNVVDSRPENHTTSLAQLTSELLIARDTHATEQPRNAP